MADAKTNPEGRPTKYKPDMINKATEYIKECPDIVPSLVGLAMELEIGERTLMSWKALDASELDTEKYPKFAEFQQMLGRLHDFQKRTALNSGADGSWNSTIAKLVLGKHGYADKHETKIDATETLKSVLDVINGGTKGILPSDDPRDSAEAP